MMPASGAGGRRFKSGQPHVNIAALCRPTVLNIVMLSSAEQNEPNFSNPYQMFAYSIRSELTRRYYERRINRFFDFIEFEANAMIEQRCNNFTVKGKSDINWALNKIMSFLQFQKDRSQRGEITPGTLINFVRAIKLFVVSLYFKFLNATVKIISYVNGSIRIYCDS